MSRYLVGIDLGTTNSALAYIDLNGHTTGTPPVITTFPISQMVALGEFRDRSLLPSFLYLPGAHDLPPGSSRLPWNEESDLIVGEFARDHGSKIPGRLINSAKSWLCHSGVDRSAPLLPWSAPPDVNRISPIDASTRYLRHMVNAWNHRMANNDPEARLEKQKIVLTVPASFDDVARNLTIEAAKKAGLEKLVLLEEPQAAFYCWLATRNPADPFPIRPGSGCLVVDVGGGTSDFTLIEAVEQQGEVGFTRKAVGDHLLLGGDNMDLALAKYVEGKFPAGSRLDATQFSLLTQSCRNAKEVLLGPNPPGKHPITIVGRGRSVVAGVLTAQITREEVLNVLMGGFFPEISAGLQPEVPGRSGLHEMGLPYVADPAITRHLAQFLRNQGLGTPGATTAPAAILFNGGVFTPEILRKRLVDILQRVYDKPGHQWEPVLLSTPSLDLAVAWGAAYFGFLQHSGGKRIGGGIARSYYLGTSGAKTSSSDDLVVVCVVPQNLEEEKELSLDRPELLLALGQPVQFPLYSSTVRGFDKAGEILHIRPDQVLELPPLHTILRGGKRSANVRDVPVTLAARATAIGTLEIYCVASDKTNRWRLEFNIRDLVKPAPRGKSPEKAGDLKQITDVWPEVQVQAAGSLIEKTFLDPDENQPSPASLTSALEEVLEAPRSEWPMGLCRRLWDFLAGSIKGRKKSSAHQARWNNLVGWCLRPGFGDSLDSLRVDQLWKLLAAPPRDEQARILASRVPEGGADYWILWRRVSGGLPLQIQQALFEKIRAFLIPAKGKEVVKPGLNELSEIWRVAASLERIDVRHKQAMGDKLTKSLRQTPVPNYALWCLTRIGARKLLHGPMNAVVHPEVVQGWIETLLSFKAANQNDLQAWAFCLCQLTRRTGQLALDIDDHHRQQVLDTLKPLSIPPHWLEIVEKVTHLEEDEEGKMLGDAPPIGIRLLEQ